MASKNCGKVIKITGGGQPLKSCSQQNLVTMSLLTSAMTRCYVFNTKIPHSLTSASQSILLFLVIHPNVCPSHL